MFLGHVYRDKVYWCWGQVLEDGTCIDGCDEILPSDPEYTEKRDFILAFKRGEACTSARTGAKADCFYRFKNGLISAG